MYFRASLLRGIDEFKGQKIPLHTTVVWKICMAEVYAKTPPTVK